jgi:prepilin-type N-terminal cleavage/methylation domain-containing protein
MGMLWGVSMKAVGTTRARHARLGFSLVEVVMTLAIGLILVSVALPMVVNALQMYRLNSIAQQTGNLIDLARASAIRRNAVVKLLTTTVRGNTVLFVDLDGDGQVGANEAMLILPSDMEILAGQTPPAGGATQDFVNQIAFDFRGAVNFPGGGSTATYVLGLDYINQKQYGARAVSVSPMGQTKLWTAPNNVWSAM